MDYMHIDRALSTSVNDTSREDSNRFFLSVKDRVQQLAAKGELKDPESVRRLTLKLLEEFYQEKDAFDQEQAKLKRDLIRQELLLSVSSTAAMQSILEATAPLNANGEPEITPEYQASMADMIADSLRSEASSMTKSELQQWAALYPGFTSISGLVSDREHQEEAIKRQFGKLPGDATGAELNKLVDKHSSQDWITKSVKFNPIKFPNLDFLGVVSDFKEIKKDLDGILTVLSQRSDRKAVSHKVDLTA